ncbi:Uncharacterised protein [Legionella wadsworthii]|uniref:Uncharacterized protein n=1 Tax=Legionella wadsworthii TaxID=28088 RepID=A0A378LUS0_9GAMM|nr:hypothetical protein [Legionella wadsworthii]STY30176.1 Uncharacterised protein [Legionella wadsworthii]
MGRLIIIGESHLDSIAEIITLHLIEHPEAKVSALGIELPENLATIDETIQHLEKSVKEYSEAISKLNFDKNSLQIESQLSAVEFMIQQVYQLQLKLDMLYQLKEFKLQFYAIDKVLQSLPGHTDLQAIMTDPERDEKMTSHIIKMAQANENTSIVIVGQAHLEKILPLLKKQLNQEISCVHCYSGLSYGEKALTHVLDKAPPMQTSWKDEQGIYHLDCRDKSIEEIADELLTISDAHTLSPAIPKKIRSGEGALEMESTQLFKSLLNILRSIPTYTFTPEFYNNYLIEDYYEALSWEDPLKKSRKIQEFVDYIETAHSPADPRLYHLYSLLALKQLDSSNIEGKPYKESLKNLERLLKQEKTPQLGEAYDKASALAQQMINILLLCKNGKQSNDTAIQKINHLFDEYQELIENYMDQGITKEEQEILIEQREKITQLKQFIPSIMQNLSQINTFQLQMVQNILSPPKHYFAEEDSREDYYEAISYFSKAMLVLHELFSSGTLSNKNEIIIENLNKAGELGFALAYVELGHFYKKQGDFSKAFNNYLKAASLGSNVGYANITLLLAEYEHKAPLAFFMSSALQFLVARSQKVNNNYTLDFETQDFIGEKQELVANQLNTKVRNSIFRSSLDLDKEKGQFSLLSSLYAPSVSNPFLNKPIDPVQLLDDFEAGLDFFLGQSCQNLYRKDNGEFLCREYAAIATIWLNILGKYENPRERMMALVMHFTDYCDNSSLNSSDSVFKFLKQAVHTVNQAIVAERANLAWAHVEDIKAGKKIAHLHQTDTALNSELTNKVLM